MRPLHIATLDKRRPVLVLTRELMVGRMSTVTVAPVTSTVRALRLRFGWGSGTAWTTTAR